MPFFVFLSLCSERLSLLNQKTLNLGQTILTTVSRPGSGVHHIIQWLLGSFSETFHWYHGPCKKYLTASGSISSQKPAITVHALQAYKNMEMTRVHNSFTFDQRDMLLSIQMSFSLVRAVVACAILERTTGLEPSPLSLSGCHWRCLSSVWSSLH